MEIVYVRHQDFYSTGSVQIYSQNVMKIRYNNMFNYQEDAFASQISSKWVTTV